MAHHKHILGNFDNALDALRTDVLMMASLTERNLINSMNGLVNRDDELCATVIADDEEIDQLEIQVDQNSIEVMIRFQPMASDLREVVAGMKLSVNLERIADQSVSIARKARKLNQHPALPEVAHLDELFKHSLSMLRDALRAYTQGDTKLARGLKARDKVLDEMNARVARILTDRMAAGPGQLKGYLNLLFIARHLERVGDHATNIAEDAVFATAAEDIRHLHGTANKS